jgi:hypothetical protein
MAKGKGLQHSDHIKGSISGQTYREYRGLQTVTIRPYPRNFYLAVKSSIQSILSDLSRLWGPLDPVLKQAWRDWATGNPQPDGMGGSFILDGNQAHIKLNHTAIRLSGWTGYSAWPPVSGSPAVVDTCGAAPTPPTGQMMVEWTTLGTPDPTDFIEVMLSNLQKYPGRAPTSVKFRSRKILAGDESSYQIDGLAPGGFYVVGVRYIEKHGQKTNIVYANGSAQP